MLWDDIYDFDGKLASYKQLEKYLAQLKADLQKFVNDPAMQQEKCFAFVKERLLPHLENVIDARVSAHAVVKWYADAHVLLWDSSAWKALLKDGGSWEKVVRQARLHEEHLNLISSTYLNKAKVVCLKLNLPTKFLTEPRHHLRGNIAGQVAECFDNIFAQPYIEEELKDSVIARRYHGVQHSTRVAIFINVFANLYLANFENTKMELTAKNIELATVAALLHDAGRRSDGVDDDEELSAITAYYYALNVLGYDKADAIIIAETILNKDYVPANEIPFAESQAPEHPNKGRYWSLSFDQSGRPMIVESINDKPKSALQKILHDADCLDIIRARVNFNVRYLDFYQDCRRTNHQEALEVLVKVVLEASRWIAWQGDTPHAEKIRQEKQVKIKHEYEQRDCYEKCLAQLNRFSFSYLSCLCTPPSVSHLIDRNYLRDLSTHPVYASEKEAMANQLMHQGRAFVRATRDPLHKRNYQGMDSINSDMLAKTKRLREISRAQIEVRKALRREQDMRADGVIKLGNPSRPTTMIGYRVPMFAEFGYMIFDPQIEKVSYIAEENQASGFGGDNQMQTGAITREKMAEELANLLVVSKLGGSAKTSNRHNEIHYHIEDFNAVFMESDCLVSGEVEQDGVAFYPSQNYLLARYLQQVYKAEKEASGLPGVTNLDIYAYRVDESRLILMPEPTEETLVRLWENMFQAFARRDFKLREVVRISKLSIEQIKALPFWVYYSEASTAENLGQSPDHYYPASLQASINQMAAECKAKIWQNYFAYKLEKISQDNLSSPDLDEYFSAFNFTEEERDMLEDALMTRVKKVVGFLENMPLSGEDQKNIKSRIDRSVRFINIIHEHKFLKLEKMLDAAMAGLVEKLKHEIDLLEPAVIKIPFFEGQHPGETTRLVVERWQPIEAFTWAIRDRALSERVSKLRFQRIMACVAEGAECVLQVANLLEPQACSEQELPEIVAMISAAVHETVSEIMARDLQLTKVSGGLTSPDLSKLKNYFEIARRWKIEEVVKSVRAFALKIVEQYYQKNPISGGTPFDNELACIIEIRSSFERMGLMATDFVQGKIFKAIDNMNKMSDLGALSTLSFFVHDKAVYLTRIFNKAYRFERENVHVRTAGSRSRDGFLEILSFLEVLILSTLATPYWVELVKSYIRQFPEQVGSALEKASVELSTNARSRALLQTPGVSEALLELMVSRADSAAKQRVLQLIGRPLVAPPVVSEAKRAGPAP